jgi:hypothetical protein
MRRLQIVIPIDDSYVPGDGFDVYWNGGSGPVDFDRPITARPVPFWSRFEPMAGHLCDAHLRNHHLQPAAVASCGHLEGAHLFGGHLIPREAYVFETEPLYVGRHRFAVHVVDSLGNTREDEAVEVERVANEAPEAPCGFRPAASASPSGRMTFAYTAPPQID